eukprot:scaffold1951_cov258-Pinguiococcus_pyrenoidosus.AAC.30
MAGGLGGEGTHTHEKEEEAQEVAECQWHVGQEAVAVWRTYLRLRPVCTRSMACARRPAIGTTTVAKTYYEACGDTHDSRRHLRTLSCSGIVSVNTSCFSGDLLILSTAGGLNTPWLQAAYTSVAPYSLSCPKGKAVLSHA